MTENTAQNILPMTLKPTVSHVPVTPDLAARWLIGKQTNRTLRAAKVNQYARDMTTNRWQLSNDAICFAPDGRLLNGQHRLSAIVKSGQTVVMLIARNMPPDAMTTMDTGSARSAADALLFDGAANTNVLASAAKQAVLYSDGRMYKAPSQQAVSHSEIRDFVALNPTLHRSTLIAKTLGRRIDASPSVLATAHWIITRHNETELADYFIGQLSSRADEPAGSAVLAIDSRLREARRHRAHYPARDYIYLLVKGWNYYARDKRVATLSLSSKGVPIPNPVRWQRMTP